MLTKGSATAIALVTLIVSCVIGGAVGFVTCLIFRLAWNLKVAIFDVALAFVVGIASAYAYSAIAMARGPIDSGGKWILLTAAISIVLRHLVRLMFRSSSQPR
jgi:hypothetical protein